MVDFPKFTIQEMLENGVHFGHKCRSWNPKMAPFIYGERNKIHIIDLQKTYPLLLRALKTIEKLIRKKPNAKILFVGTKHQASEHIKESALKCGQFYVDRRWLGGTLTNWHTVSRSIITLESLEKKVDAIESGETSGYRKKEILTFKRKRDKLERVLGGIRKLKGKPDIMFVVDARTENIAIREAQKFGVPVVCIVDTNSNPDGIDYVIPGNDDSSKAIKFYCDLISGVILYALAQVFSESGVTLEEITAAEEQQEEPVSPELELVVSDTTGFNIQEEMAASGDESVEEGTGIEVVEPGIITTSTEEVVMPEQVAAEQPLAEEKPAKNRKTAKK